MGRKLGLPGPGGLQEGSRAMYHPGNCSCWDRKAPGPLGADAVPSPPPPAHGFLSPRLQICLA